MQEKKQKLVFFNNYMNETISSFKIRSENVGKTPRLPIDHIPSEGKEGLFSEGYGHKHKMTLQS